MRRVYAILLVSASLLLCLFASCISREAAERNGAPEGQVVDDTTYCTVTFYDGQTMLRQVNVAMGGHVQDYPKEHEWRDAEGMLVDMDELTVTGNIDLYAVGNAALRTTRVAYLRDEGPGGPDRPGSDHPGRGER